MEVSTIKILDSGSPNNAELCESIVIIDDDLVEEEEMFVLTMEILTESFNVNIEDTQIIITDNESESRCHGQGVSCECD